MGDDEARNYVHPGYVNGVRKLNGVRPALRA